MQMYAYYKIVGLALGVQSQTDVSTRVSHHLRPQGLPHLCIETSESARYRWDGRDHPMHLGARYPSLPREPLPGTYTKHVSGYDEGYQHYRITMPDPPPLPSATV